MSYQRGLADGADEESPVRDSDEDYLRGYAEGRLDPTRALAALLVTPHEALDTETARQRGRADALERLPRQEGSAEYLAAYAEIVIRSPVPAPPPAAPPPPKKVPAAANAAPPVPPVPPVPEPDLGRRFTLLEID